MGLIKTWNTVQFDLELIVDFDYHIMNKENGKKLHEVAGKVRTKIAESYPAIELYESTIISGEYGGEDKGPALNGKTNVRIFKEAFGNNIKRGFSLLFPPTPTSIPCDTYVKWYQTGDLIVPDSLKDIVKGIYISRLGMGSFGELNLSVPSNAIKY